MSQMRLGSKSSDSFICILNDAYEVIKTDYTNIMKKIVISKKSKVMLGDSSVTEESTFEPGGVVSFYRETTMKIKQWSVRDVMVTRKISHFSMHDGHYCIPGYSMKTYLYHILNLCTWLY